MHGTVRLFGLGFVGVFVGLATVAAHRPELGVQCGTGSPGRPNVIAIQVEDASASGALRIVGGLKPNREQQTEIEISAGQSVATCHASGAGPFLVWAQRINSGNLSVANSVTMQVEILSPKQTVLASAKLEPGKLDTLNLGW